MYCTNCGSKIDSNEKICNNCGAQIEKQPDYVFPVKNLYTAQTEASTQNGIFSYKTLWMLLGCVLILAYLIKAFMIPAFNPPPYVPFNGAVVTPQVIMSNDDFKISVEKLDYGKGEKRRNMGLYLNVENHSDKDIDFNCFSLCVNGVTVYPDFKTTVEAGQTKEEMLAFDIDSLKRFNIDTIGKINIYLLSREHSDSKWKKSDLITIETTKIDEASKPKLKESKKKIFSNKKLKVSFVGIKGYHATKNDAITFLIENKSSDTVILKGKENKINDIPLSETETILQGNSVALMHIFANGYKLRKQKPYKQLDGKIEVYTDKMTLESEFPFSIKNP